MKLLQFLLCSIPLAAFAAQPTDVAPGVRLIRGEFSPGIQPDGNSVLLTTPDGLIVVDTGRHAQHTQKIIDYATATHLSVAAI